MSDSLGPPPKGGDANRAPTMLGVFGALGLLSVLCAAARIYTRIRLLRVPGVDDAVILFCAVSRVLCFSREGANVSTCLDTGCHGLWDIGQSYNVRPREARVLLDHREFSTQYQMGLYQCSIWYYERRATQTCRCHLFIQGCGTYQALSDWSTLLFRCHPDHIIRRVSHLAFRTMLPTIRLLEAKHSALMLEFYHFGKLLLLRWRHVHSLCLILSTCSDGVAAYSAFNDLVLAIFPATVIFKLQMSRKRRYGISFLMSLGVL